MDQIDTRRTINYIRGVAIGLVIIAHFGGYYYGYYNENRLGIFVNAVSLFFVVSGFGIYHTLEKNFTEHGINFRTVIGFFVARYAKILPIYWLALAVYLYIEPQWYSLDGFSLLTLGELLLVPLKPAPGIMWFFTSLFHCYLWAPLLYLIIKKLQPRSFFFAVIGVIGLFLPVSYWFVHFHAEYLPGAYEYFYRDFFMANVIIFSLGMLIPPLIATYPDRFKNRFAGLSLLAGYLAFAAITRFPSDQPLKTIPFILLNFGLFLYAVSINPRLPLSRPVTLMGRYSLSLFLFHAAYFVLFKQLGLLEQYNVFGVMLTLLLFPYFLLSCIFIQDFFLRRYRGFMAWYQPHFGFHRPVRGS